MGRESLFITVGGKIVNAKVQLDRGLLAAFCRRWRIRELCVFGSALRDDFGPESLAYHTGLRKEASVE